MKLNREIHMPENVLKDLLFLCKKHHVKKMILFGSRARGDELPKSDIDLAIKGCDHFSDLAYDIDNHTRTLLQFDMIDLDQPVSEELKQQITRDGIELFSEE